MNTIIAKVKQVNPQAPAMDDDTTGDVVTCPGTWRPDSRRRQAEESRDAGGLPQRTCVLVRD
jgi:hypothetical protein